jgi:hypothetical protein
MKVLIQHCNDQKYIAADGSWTAAIGAAHDFRFSPYAYEVIRKEKFHNATVIFYYEDMGYSLRATRTKTPKARLAQELNSGVASL